MSATLHVIWPYLRREWRALALASGASVAIAGAEILRPFPLKFVIDHLFGAARSGQFTIGLADIVLVFAVAVLVLAIALVEAAGDYVVDVHLERAGERIVHDLRVAIYAQLQRLSLGFHRRRHTGDLVTRVTGDVSAVGDIFSSSVGTLATSALTLIGMVAVGLLIDPLLAIVAFATTPLVGFVAIRFRQRMGMLQRRQRAVEGEIASLATEALSSIAQVKALGAEGYEHERLERKSEERRAAGFEATMVEGQFTRLIDIVGAIATGVVLIVGVFRVSDGALSPGDLVVMVTYGRRVYKPLRDIAREWVRFSRSMARAERVAELLAADEMLEERSVAARRDRARGAVEFQAVSFAYMADRPALVDVSLAIPARERLAIVGPSGAGKSTLAALAARFYDPSSGRVLIDGVDARDVPLAWLREQVGLVLQDPVLFTGSVADNLAWGIEASRHEVVRAAQAVGADDFIRALPQGYDTQLDPGGTGLSGGQRQRIAVARTLLRDPVVLLLDEPTTGLDAASEEQVLAGLDVLMSGRTTVIVTHSPALARRADRVAVMERGRLVRTGSPAELLPMQADERARPLTSSPTDDGLASDGRERPRLTDPALPQLPLLLDTAAVAPILGRSFNGGTPLGVTVRYLRYKPATNLVVQYDVIADGAGHQAVGIVAAGEILARRAARPEAAALAVSAGARTHAAIPLAYERDVDALFQWYPLDLSLPMLACPPRDLRRALRAGGLDVRESDAEPERLAYKPRRRAVLRVDDHVVRLYARHADFERAIGGQRAANALAGVRAPRLEGASESRLITVQSVVAGVPVGEPAAVARRAGQLLGTLHRQSVSGLRAFGPAEQLDATRGSARLVATIVPDLAPQLDALMAAFVATTPRHCDGVTAHGDFSSSQLLASNGELALVDFDEFCLAPKGMDAANYAADLVRGGVTDLASAASALDELLAGYGRWLPDMRWWFATMVLRQAPWPFRHFEREWPTRVAQIVADAREVLDHA